MKARPDKDLLEFDNYTLTVKGYHAPTAEIYTGKGPDNFFTEECFIRLKKYPAVNPPDIIIGSPFGSVRALLQEKQYEGYDYVFALEHKTEGSHSICVFQNKKKVWKTTGWVSSQGRNYYLTFELDNRYDNFFIKNVFRSEDKY